MNKKLIAIIGCAVAAVGSIATLSVVYVKFQKANKALKGTTIGDALAEQAQNESDVEDEDTEMIEDTDEPDENPPADEEPVPAPKLVKKESKKNVANTPAGKRN